MSADTATSVSYLSGNWIAVVGLELWLLIDGRGDEPLLQHVWAAARQRDGLVTVEQLAREEVVANPRSFGLVATSGTGLVVLVSGEALVQVGTDGGGEMRCPSGVSIAEYRLSERPPSVILRGGTVSDRTGLPIDAGLTRAAEVRLEWSDPPGRIWKPDAKMGQQEAEDKGAGAAAVIVTGPVERRDPDPGATLLPSSLSDLEATGDLPKPDEIIETKEIDETGATAEVEKARGSDAEDGYDDLFGHTVSRTVEDAAVRPEDPPAPNAPVPSASARSESSVPTPAPNAAPPVPEPLMASPTPTPMVRAASTGLIDAVPWASAGTEPGASEFGEAGEEALGLTISRAAQKALLGQQTPIPSNPGGPTVHAVRCPGQHPNPAHAGTCRICGSPIEDQAPVTVPRPVLGRLRLSTGGEVTLDRGVLMGRGPTEGRQVGGERPHVVKLPSPGNDISRNHLEVRLDGWHVLVTDLNSTNGTLVTRPGRLPERLRPDQPAMIEPGTVVTLADDVTFTFEVV